MAIFYENRSPSLEELLLEPAIDCFLQILVENFLFLTIDQIHDLLRECVPPGMRPRRFRDHLRTVLSILEDGEYLDHDSVELLPPVTIGTCPLFRLERVTRAVGEMSEPKATIPFSDEPVFRCFEENYRPRGLPTTADLIGFQEIAKRRVPLLDKHRKTNLYFATRKYCDLLYSRRGYGGRSLTDYRKLAMRLIEQHRQAESGNPPSTHEIAGTDLTALLNVHEFLLGHGDLLKIEDEPLRRMGRSGSKYSERYEEWDDEKRCWEYPDGVGGGATLFFLRPGLSNQVRDDINRWWADRTKIQMCWWL